MWKALLDHIDRIEARLFAHLDRVEAHFGVSPDQFIVTQTQISATLVKVQIAAAAVQNIRALIGNFKP